MHHGYIHGWDGVRALAVAAVVVYHLDAPWLPGGFLGVTTFLVLAGALATGRIGGEIVETGRFDVRRYAAGRARRLLPALIVYVGVVLIWTWVAHPHLFRSLTDDAAAALLYITPWREMSSPTGYAAAFDAGPAPFLHTWSLGVEEVAWIVTGVAIALTRRPAAAAATTLAIGAVGYGLWFGDADVYYSPARLAEFGTGTVLGIALTRRRGTLGWGWGLAGGAVLVALMATVSVDDVYTGRLVLAALASVVLVAATVEGPLATVLSWAPLRWAGTRSYSLYLWHVGLIELTDLGVVGVLVTTAALSELSYRLVENPVRHRQVLPRRAVPVLAGVTAALAAFAAIGPRPATLTGLEQAAAAVEAAAVQPIAAGATAEGADPEPEPAADPGRCGDCRPSPIEGAAPFSVAAAMTPADDPVRVAILGDSTGEILGRALAAWGEVTGELVLDDLTVGGCSPLHFSGSGWYRTRIRPDDAGERERAGCMPTIVDVEPGVDLVFVVETGTPMLDHLRPDGVWVDLTDTAMAETLARHFATLRSDAEARDLTVVVATAASMPDAKLESMRDLPPVEAFNDVLEASGLVRYDLTTPLESGDYHRFDGVHLHIDSVLPYDGEGRNEGHRYVAEVAGPALVAYARGLTR